MEQGKAAVAQQELRPPFVYAGTADAAQDLIEHV